MGDSRCVVARNKKAHPLSKDHKPDDQEEKVRIEKAGGTVVNGRINKIIDVSRAFGDYLFKSNDKLNKKEQMITSWPHTRLEQIQPKEDRFMLLMCDGIWNAMDNQVVVSHVSHRLDEGMPLADICKDVILKQVLPKGSNANTIIGRDNMTIMIVKPVTEKPKSKENTKSKKATKPKSNESSIVIRNKSKTAKSQIGGHQKSFK